MGKLKQLLELKAKQAPKEPDYKEQLETALSKINEISDTYKLLDEQMKENKNLIKKICIENNLDGYTAECGKIAKISRVDKSYLEPGATLQYLKDNKLDKFIKIKEFFDENDLAMAIANNEIKAEDLARFTVTKEEIRLNIK